MQQDKSTVLEGLAKINFMVYHVGGRALLIRNDGIGERESEGEKTGGGERNVVGKGKKNALSEESK